MKKLGQTNAVGKSPALQRRKNGQDVSGLYHVKADSI